MGFLILWLALLGQVGCADSVPALLESNLAALSSEEVLNEIPTSYVSPNVDYRELERLMAQKRDDLNADPIGRGDGLCSDQVELKGFPWIRQECRNWCGPAAVSGVLAYRGIRVSQSEIARRVVPPDRISGRPGECARTAAERFYGACLADMVQFLNTRLKRHDASGDGRRLYSGENIGRVGGYKSIAEAGAHLVEVTVKGIRDYRRPLIALINQTGFGTSYKFPGWQHTQATPYRAHYVTLIGYRGAYNRRDRSGFLVFRESSGRTGPHTAMPQEAVDVNTVAATLIANNGKGGCFPASKSWNLIW